MYVLGIDGGGTKTKGVIANSMGKVVAVATVGASNPNSVAKSAIEMEMEKLINSLSKQCYDIFPYVKRVFAGMSGVEHPSAKKEMKSIISSVMPADVRVTVDNDGITALYSGTFGKPGIVQIAGTGSITYGLNQSGERDRVGGWGYLLGENGSGFSIGRDGLNAAFLAYDGVTGETELSTLLLNHFQVNKLPDIVKPIYQGENSKEMIASLSKIVVEAADNDDKIAKDIIRKNGIYMGESIATLIMKLFKKEEVQVEKIPVVLTGGIFNRLDLFRDVIEDVITANNIKANLIVPKIEPVGGAVVAALCEENSELNKYFLDNFSKIK